MPIVWQRGEGRVEKCGTSGREERREDCATVKRRAQLWRWCDGGLVIDDRAPRLETRLAQPRSDRAARVQAVEMQ